MFGVPDLLVSGRLHTLDPARPQVSALLAREGKIVCLGSVADCRRAARRGAAHLDAVCGVPGLVDAHGHVVLLARSLEEVDCRGTRDEEACVALARMRASSLSDGAWVLGRGWDEGRWPGRHLPRESSLSAAVPDHPVLLERIDGHAAWVNARALALAGVDRATPDPPGGRILRDNQGRPTGILLDSAQTLVRARIPHPSADEICRLIEVGTRELVRAGLTAVHDAGCTSSVMRAYARLAAGDRLPLRVYAMIDGDQPEGSLAAELARHTETPEQGRLCVRAVKLFADGALGSRGAALLDEYADDPGNHGLFVSNASELRAQIGRVARAGFQPAVHAIGDAACREVLRTFALLESGLDLKRLRPRVEHLQIVRPEDLPLLGSTGAVASMQPVHALSDAPWVESRLGKGSTSLACAYRWRGVLEHGVPLAFGSDFPVESPDPRLGLCAAVRGQPWFSGPLLEREKLSREEALRAFTAGAAFASFSEGRRGVLREGADADLTLFGEDLLEVPVERLPSVPLVATVVGGRVEYVAGTS